MSTSDSDSTRSIFASELTEAVLGSVADCAALSLEGEIADPRFPADTPVIVAVLGFTSDEMKGSLLMAADLDWAAATHPTGAEADQQALRDWMGEIANMVLGRVKNRLIRRTVVLNMATPTAIVGRDLDIPSPRTSEQRWSRFVQEGHQVLARFDVVTSDGYELPPESADAEESAAEGELMLF